MKPRKIRDLSPGEQSEILNRSSATEEVSGDVADLIEQVRSEGNDAVRELTQRFDGVELNSLEIPEEKLRGAKDDLDPDVVEAIETAADRIRGYHEKQVRDDWRVEKDGVEMGRRFRPLESAGAYVPGGGAAYPSTALMTVLPAKIAGVERVTACSPPPIPNGTLAALDEAGVDEVYRVGGVQAIATLALGTESVKSVDAVVGPGNRYVTEAKKQLRDRVRTEFPAGPSEIAVVADQSAEPEWVAADLVAQLEHDADSRALLVTPSAELAESVAEEVERLRNEADREDARQARIDVLVDSMDECVGFVEEFAPEHLSIVARDDEEILERIGSAGSIFLGSYTPVAAGDYASGTNHVLPTAGGARLYGGLSVEDFVRPQSVQRLSSDGLEELEDTITRLARLEGLEMHARSVEARRDK